MSVFSAIDTAVSGLDAQAAALSNISNNISNSSTVGYKQANTDFESLVLAGSASSSPALAGATTSTSMDISTAGQTQTTNVNTDIAVSGNGFMVVNDQAASATGTYLVTRAGSFRPDSNGNLVNAGGYYLQGQPLDANGVPIGTPADTLSGLSTVNVSNLAVTASPTTAITFNANLPSSETQYAATPPAPSSTSVQYNTPLGATQTLTFQFVPTLPATATAPATNTWTMNVFDSASATPTTPISTASLVFNGTGANAGTLASVTPAAGGTYNATTGAYSVTAAGGQVLPITIGALGSTSGMSQLNGPYTTTNMKQNGGAFGQLQGVSVGKDGVVTASFSNGTTRPIYQVDLAVVPSPDSLTPVAGDAYALSPAAGLPQLFKPGQGPAGATDGGTLEGSNVDLTTQLTNLIETQRAYSSNATVIQTADQMLETVEQIHG
jgi:flagellar hook protein FlgE